MLSIAAAYGVCRIGARTWLGKLFNIPETPVPASADDHVRDSVGLSMDYEVFLLSPYP